MSDQAARALERFRQLYLEFRRQREKLNEAGRWIVENHPPYRIGEMVQVPNNGTASGGKLIKVTKIVVEVDPETGRIYWAISGENGFWRQDVRHQMPESSKADQDDLLF